MTERPLPQSHDDYTVGWICAIEPELTASVAMLDVVYDQKLDQARGDTNNYIFGRIGAHNVVMASLPSGEYGIGAAAIVARQMDVAFPRLVARLMVGVGGGVPHLPPGKAAARDIRLGDVVVSDSTPDSPGVFQYDLGKKIEGKQRPKRIETTDRPPPLIRSIVSTLKAKHRLKGDPLSQHLIALVNHHPDLSEEFVYQGASKDVLFEVGNRHKLDAKDCTACDTKRIVKRGQRSATFPRIHYGTIASGNQVVKDSTERDYWRDEADVLCFDMEAAGLMNHFPCLVIRGICDYADSHKNKRWQPYAAAVAAAYAKEILIELAPEAVQDARRTDLVLCRQSAYDEPREAWQMQHCDRVDVSKLRPRISDYDQERAHRRLKRKRVHGTTEWFIRHPVLERWMSDAESLSIWCSGSVGSGKTMICTKLVDHMKLLAKQSGDAVIFFYCERSDRKTLNASYLLESLTRQLLDYLEIIHRAWPMEVQNRIQDFYSPEGPKPDFEDLAETFSLLFSSVPRAVYIIDGLDEMDPGASLQIVSLLRDLLKLAKDQNILVASRDELDVNIKAVLGLHIRISRHDTDPDIRFFIAEAILKKETHRVITDDAAVMETLKERLYEMAKGMFLWIQLQIEIMWETCSTASDILLALDSLPSDLDEIYRRCLARIPARSRHLASRALRWVTCSSRPLHVSELQEAVVFDFSHDEWSKEKIPSRSEVLGSCVNLVVLDEDDQFVRLTHPTVEQYLCGPKPLTNDDFWIDKHQATLQCGEECVNYLSFSNFGLALQKHSPDTLLSLTESHQRMLTNMPFSSLAERIVGFRVRSRAPGEVKIRLPKQTQHTLKPEDESCYSLLQYARQNWAIQTKSITHESRAWGQFSDLALQPNTTWNLQPWTSSGRSNASYLHGLLAWATRERHVPLLSLLIDTYPEKDLQQFCDLPFARDGFPALHMAARLGFVDVVRILLRVCKVNSKGPQLQTALHYAAEKGHDEVAELLLSQKGVDVLFKSKFRMTAIELAAAGGNVVMVPAMIARAPPMLRDKLRWQVLDIAAFNSHTGLMETILQDLRLTTITRVTPREEKKLLNSFLNTAAERGNETVARLLVELTQIDVNAKGYSVRPALSIAAEHGHIAVVELLTECTNIDVNPQDQNGQTPVSLAAGKGHLAVVELLAKCANSNLNLQDQYGQSPLSRAAGKGHLAVVELLVKCANSNLNLQDQYGQSPLSLAAGKGHVAIVELLARRSDVDVNLQDKYGQTPLSLAAGKGHVAIIEVLARRSDIDVNSQDEFGRTPLYLAAEYGRVAVVELLMKRTDVNVNLQNDNGRTPLSFVATRYGRIAVAELLTRRADINVNSRDQYGRTALHYAAEKGHVAVVELLVKRKDLDVWSKDREGQSAFSRAASGGHKAVTALLNTYRGA